MKFIKYPLIIGLTTSLLSVSCKDQEKKENKKLKNELAESELNLASSREDLERSEEKLAETLKNLDETSQAFAKEKDVVRTLEFQLSTRKLELNLIQDTVDSLTRNVDKLLKQKNNLESELARSLQDKEALRLEVSNLESQVAETQAKLSQALTAKAKLDVELTKKNAEISNIKGQLEQAKKENESLEEKLAEASRIPESDAARLAQAVKNTLEFKTGIYISPGKISLPNANNCFHIAEVKEDGHIQLAIACAGGEVEILTAQVAKFDAQRISNSLAQMGLLLELKTNHSCPTSSLLKYKGLVLDKGLLDFSVIDVETVVLQDEDQAQIALTSVAMIGFVTPTPSLELARRIARDNSQAPNRQAVVHYMEKSLENSQSGCFDPNFSFQPMM